MTDPIYWTDAGITDILKTVLGIQVSSKFATGVARLYKNSYTCSNASAWANFTESTFPGYGPIALTGASWGSVSVVSHLASSLAASSFSYTCTGGGPLESAYGIFITDAANTLALACWNFTAGPFVFVNNGDNILSTPTLTEQSVN